MEREHIPPFVTLATSNTYAQRALVFGRSMRQAFPARMISIKVTDDISRGLRTELSQVFDDVSLIDIPENDDKYSLALQSMYWCNGH